jgi:serine/threonine protein kinase/Tfp pilus assembly protein PilF
MSALTAIIGRTLGHYRVIKHIGSGGMGVVFLAYDTRLERDVALKILPPGAIADDTARKRLRREALTLSKLSHPKIARIYDFDSQDGTDFLVMEYVKGTTLAGKLVNGSLNEKEAVELAIEIAGCLEDAHAAGIVHCDLKPANIMVSPQERVTLLDFGLAVLFRSPETEKTLSLSALTPRGGTPPYMAPEQMRGRSVDVRVDVYALGVILYEMVTGRLPFLGSGAELIDSILNRAPEPPRIFCRELHRDLEAVVLKALNKHPDRRQQTAKEFRDDLQSLGSVRSLVKIVRPKRRRSLAILGLTISLALALTLGVVERIRTPSIPALRQLAVLPFRNLGADSLDPVFTQGLVENITSKLAQLTLSHPLQVVSAEEVHASSVSTLQQARKQLGVNLVIEGSLQRAGGLVRININLNDTNSGRLLRSETMTEDPSEPFKLEDKIVQATVRMLQLELRQSEQQALAAHGTPNIKAYDLYTRGRGYSQSSDKPENVDSAVNQFLQAINLDPTYAAAYAGLGEAYWLKYLTTRDRDWVPKVKEACEHSRELDPGLPEGDVCLGTLNNGIGKYQIAASEFELALNADPSSDTAYRGLASAYEQMGSAADAERIYKQAIQVRPQYASSHTWLGAYYSRQARYSEAAQEFENAVKMAPENASCWASLGGIYLVLGKHEQATSAFQRSISIRPSFEAYSNLGLTYFAQRRFQDAIAALEQAVSLGDRQIQAYGNLARAYYWFEPKRHLARAEFEKAIHLAEEDLKVNPNDADAHILAAEYSAMIGRNRREVLAHLNAALHLRPRDPETLFFAGIVYTQLGNPEQGLSWLEKSVKAGYSPSDIEAAIELDSLKSDPRFKSLLKKVSNRQFP